MGEIKIYTDESVEVAIAQGLQRRGVEAFSARDRDKLGLTDEAQLIFAREEKATISIDYSNSKPYLIMVQIEIIE
jgi:hypothetical protein